MRETYSLAHVNCEDCRVVMAGTVKSNPRLEEMNRLVGQCHDDFRSLGIHQLPKLPVQTGP
jgi:hypothetical protein